ncbi:DMT family transporter [Sulfodiicoccus acidiphilus]|nr:EamA family transporter [Sulfodiicoccus acidiphilus]
MKRDLILLTLGGASFGTAAIFVAISSMTPATIAVLRFLLAGAILATLRGTLKYFKRTFPYALLLGIHMFLFIQSVKSTAIIDATVLVSTSPIFAIPIAKGLGVNVSKTDLWAALLAVLGVIVMNYPLVLGEVLGNVEALGAALATAFYTILLNKRTWDADPISMTSSIYLEAALIMSPLILIQGIGVLNARSWLAIAGLVALPTLVGHSTVIYLSKRVRPQVIDTFTLLEPVVATILAFIIFGQMPTNDQVVGATIVIFSLVLLFLRS